MKVYEFLYNDNIWESYAGTQSIHKTRKDAEIALEFHKAEIMKEECLLTNDERLEMFWWGIRETELKD